jgi:hypothetical protein
MTASKIAFRDLLGLILILSFVTVILGVLFDVLALMTYLSHEYNVSNLFFHESLPLYFFVIPVFIIGRYINRPAWISAVQEYHLKVARKSSE